MPLTVPTALPTAEIKTPVATLLPPTSPAPSTYGAPTAASTYAAPSVAPTINPNVWQDMPVIPTVSARARAIFRRGQELGNNPGAFSKIGDCESTSTWFLSDFDMGPRAFQLGDYVAVHTAIEHFTLSFKRNSLAVRPGFTATSVITPLWADPKECQVNETPLDCEYRIHRPAFAIIMLGSNDTPRPERFEPKMRIILDRTIELGIVPILVTKADNLEGDHAINAAIARLAGEYDIPLWNFWRAVQPLPHAGLQDDKAHLTWAPNNFADPAAMKAAWPWRNLTALQTLKAVWEGVQP